MIIYVIRAVVRLLGEVYIALRYFQQQLCYLVVASFIADGTVIHEETNKLYYYTSCKFL